MKTFFHLKQEVQDTGLCHHCGGCVAFCSAINYGALEMGPDGKPRYKDEAKCIECGICHAICPEVDELDAEIQRRVAWSQPIGRVMETTVARAGDPEIRTRGTDGGVVTALLIHLLEMGRIDGAIVSKPLGPFSRQPWLALNRQDILDAAGFHFDTSHGIAEYSETYSTYSPSIQGLAPVARKGLHRVAFVGTPCQIITIRKMEALGIVPADAIGFHLGLFCGGNFQFQHPQRQQLELLGDFKWEDVKKVNVKQDMIIHLANGDIRTIPMENLDFMKRFACRYCADYTAEYADLSFGGIGANQGWTTVLIRTPLGRAVFADARQNCLEELTHKDEPEFASQAMRMIYLQADKKKTAAQKHRKQLGRSETSKP